MLFYEKYHTLKLKRGINWFNVRLENTKYSDYAYAFRATYCIRRFFCWIKLKKRIRALKEIATHVVGINTKYLLLD
jgi:hypothetical protein